jgi:hypothetical protein
VSYLILKTKNLEISVLSVLHNEECWNSDIFCTGKKNPCGPKDNTPYRDTDGILKILDSLVISELEVQWDEMYSLIVGFELEDWK